jgi:hydroxymethylpyrimidine pyrophosphatase-like HAD family hydrolase
VRYLALCCDYDGTLAEDGRVSSTTLNALERLRASGRKVVLVTGRVLAELRTVCGRLDLFDLVVAENGACLYNPATDAERVLAARPPEIFIETLRRRGVKPLSVGRVVVAAWLPQETIVLNAIHDLGLELQVIFNKDAVMVLPTGVNKASGLAVALRDLNLSPCNIVGIGDAENDHAFLAACQVGVAVENALPLLKDAADFVTRNARGAGVVELIEELLHDDLRARDCQLSRRRMVLGLEESGEEILQCVHDFNALLVGTQGSELHAATSGLLQRLTARGYNFCVVDPEGSFTGLEHALALGSATQAPALEEAWQLLNTYDTNVVVSLEGVPIGARADFFALLIKCILETRARTGRPHWVVINEFGQLFRMSTQGCGPAPWPSEGVLRLSERLESADQSALRGIKTVLAFGHSAQSTLDEVGAASDIAAALHTKPCLKPGEALYWSVSRKRAPRKIILAAGRSN